MTSAFARSPPINLRAVVMAASSEGDRLIRCSFEWLRQLNEPWSCQSFD